MFIIFFVCFTQKCLDLSKEVVVLVVTGAQVNGLYEKLFSQQERVTQAQTSLKTVEQVGWGDFGVFLLLLSLCQIPLGKESRPIFCDDSSGPWISHQSILSALCIPVFFFFISFSFFPVLLPVFGCTSSAHPSPWQKHLSLCSPAKAWCHSGSSSTDRELILPLLCLALPAWVDGKGWFWVELTMSSQLDLNCKTDYLCKSMLWCWTISVTLLFLFSRVFF